VNNQIVLYLFSRILIGISTLLYKIMQEKFQGSIGWIEKGYGYYLLAAVCWGVVMWLFEEDRKVLQPGLKSSMEFLYKESDQVGSVYELIPFYPNNTEVSKKRS